jgi:GNAT superfamily N-acetyltransferase
VTISEASLRLEALSSHHDRDAFKSNNDALDRYIREQAGQDMRRDLARIFVAVPVEDARRIAGYFALSATSVLRSDLPAELSRKLPSYPIPAALVGRLAVDQAFAGSGLGSALLGAAVRRIVAVSDTLAVKVVVVDPIDEAASGLCAQFGFRHFAGSKDRMYLLVSAGSFPAGFGE